MPTHETHRKICSILGYDINLCNCINVAIDMSETHDIGRKPPTRYIGYGLKVGYPPWTSMLELLPKVCPGDIEVLLELAFVHHLSDWMCESWYRPYGNFEEYVERQAEAMINKIDTYEKRLGDPKRLSLGGIYESQEMLPEQVWERIKPSVLNHAQEICSIVLSDQMCIKKKEYTELRSLLEILDCLKIRGIYWTVNGQIFPSYASVFTKVRSNLDKGIETEIKIGPCKVDGSAYEQIIGDLLKCLEENSRNPCVAKKLGIIDIV